MPSIDRSGCKKFLASLLIICFLSVTVFFLGFQSTNAGVTVTATVPGVCGNAIIEPGEQCDSGNLNSKTCSDFNFTGGTLSCSGACSFDVSMCTGLVTPPSGGGGGGGGGRNNPSSGITFRGKAYPLSKVTLLNDGHVAISTISGPDASFSITLSSITSGNHIFALYAEDSKGLKSNLFSVPVFVTPGAGTLIQGIFLAPTIAIDKIEVKKNEVLAIFGQSIPKSEVTILVNSATEIVKNADADADGVYLYNLDTSILEYGDHGVRSRARVENDISGISPVLSFKVSDKNVVAPPPAPVLIGDFNRDGRVNLVDFSIGAYWHKRAGFPKEIDLNHDGLFNLVDFSILAYHWTG